MIQNQYIATFFAHFGAIRFRNLLKEKGIEGRMMPVPRALSSSCGTCVAFCAQEWSFKDPCGEIEQVVRVTKDGYESVYKAEDS